MARSRLSCRGASATALVAVMLLSACGTQLDSRTLAAANAGTTTRQGSAGDTGGVADATGSDTTAGAEPVVGTNAGGAAAGGGDAGGGATGSSPSGGAAPTRSTAGGGAAGDGTSGDGTGSTGSGAGGGATGGSTPAPANCAGFKNGTGITDKTITIGNVAEITGPVPGVAQGAQDAVRAYAAYFNQRNSICGRKLEVKTYDSQTSAGGNQQADTAACDEVFANVGSNSAFDDGGAPTVAKCGLPDISGQAYSGARLACSTCFAINYRRSDAVSNAEPDVMNKAFPGAGQHAAYLYFKVGISEEIARTQIAAYEKRGFKFDYVQGVDLSEFNYAPYAKAVKDKGIQYLMMAGAGSHYIRMAQAMQQQGYRPKVFSVTYTAYNADFISAGGSAVDGNVVVPIAFVPLEESASSKELQTYQAWLQQVRPGAKPDAIGVYSWAAAALFVHQALALGGRLTRASLVESLKTVRNYTANGLVAPVPVGSKALPSCLRFVRVSAGKWVSVPPAKYSCGITKI